MSFPLLTFEQHLPSSILGRGLDYYEGGAVANLARDGDTYIATVYGTEAYEATVTAHDGQVDSWSCDCPYDYGPLCKHVAALLFEVRELENDPARGAEMAGKESREPVPEILKQLPEEEMRQLLQFFAQRHDEVRAHLLTKYAHLIRDPGREHFQTLIRSFIEARSGDRDWWIDYRNASRLGSDVFGLLYDTRQYVGKGGEMQVVYACEEAIRQLSEAIKDADDSGGGMGDTVKYAFSTLAEFCAEALEIPERVVAYIFNLALKESDKLEYRGWWEDNWRQLAACAVRNHEQAERLMEKLAAVTVQKDGDGYSREYEAEEAAKLHLQLLEKWRGPEEARAFLRKNLYFASFRQTAIEQAFAAGDYDDARRMAEGGIFQDIKSKLPRRANRWKEWLVKIAAATGDRTARYQWLEKLYLETRDMQYYLELKSEMGEAEFQKKVEAFLSRFRRGAPADNPNWFNPSIAAIFLEENRLEELMEMLQAADPQLWLLDQYAPVLSQKFTENYLILYDHALRRAMDEASGRKEYQRLAGYLSRIEKLGGRAAAQEIAADWKKVYAQRRAMVDELERAGW